MLASHLRGPGQIEVEDAPDPEVTGPGELLVRLEHAAICGSDLKAVAAGGGLRGTAPRAGSPGHECVGVVVASTSDDFQPGDQVLAITKASNGFAELMTVPAAECVRVPTGLSSDCAVLGQQLGTVIHALRPVGSLLDRTVAIVGQGPAGLAFLGLARAMGARAVVTLERRPARKAASAMWGADAALEADEADVVERTAAALGNPAGADLVVDAAGGQSAISLAYRLVRPFGSVLHYGLPAGAVQLDHEVAFRKQSTTYRTVHAQWEEDLACFELALRILARGAPQLPDVVSHHFPLARLPEAFALANDPAGDALKVVVDIG